MTEQPRWDDVKRLFQAVVALDERERDEYLRQACADEPQVLAEVQSLLAWDEDSSGFLQTPVVRVADLPLPTADDDLLGTTLGAWRIVALIGRGGMGVVYRAERADTAFERQAAIKLVLHGENSAKIVERLRRERETLAALDHPNIARLMDGGTTADGQPYFVMEFVDGVRIDKYCDEQRFTIDQRLAIFRTICGAVQYAHQNLVIHRDIKPDNILVALDGTPKLLDFGIAKLLSDGKTNVEDEPATQATWLMTPHYASPEQVAGQPVTTASDVYSLGVLLHVLLTGVRPYRLTGTTQSAIQDELEAATLTRPSELIKTDHEGAEEHAAQRKITTHQLSKRLGGDLDAILLRALARDRASRYATVEQLSEDLERHRTGHPVAARRAEVGYVARAFLRRHAMALSLAAGVVLMACAGVAAIVIEGAAAAEARARAERRFDDVRRLAQTFMFDIHDAIVNVPGTMQARALMVRTAVKYLDSLATEAGDDRSLQRELASAYVKVGDGQGHPTSPNVGDTAGARASYQRAIAIAGALVAASADDVDAARTLAMAHRRLGDVLAWTGDTKTALAHCEESRTLFAGVASRPGSTVEDRLQAGIAQIKLGDLLGNPSFPNLGRSSEARAHYDAALELLRKLRPADAPTDQRVRRYVGLTLERIGTMHESAKEWSEAAAAYRESFDIRQALAAVALSHVDIQRDLAIAYEKLGNVQRFSVDLAGAATSYRGALNQFQRLAAADPSNASAARTVAISREKLSAVLGELGQTTESIDLIRASLEAHRILAARDPQNAQARCDGARVGEILGDALQREGGVRAPAMPAACSLWEESLTTRRALRAAGASLCGDAADIERLTGKLAGCR